MQHSETDSKRVVVVGTGYVGLVTGACLAEFGCSVVCVDADAAKIARLSCGEISIYEPKLRQLVTRNVAAQRLCFTTTLGPPAAAADVIFIAVGTPSDPAGHADLGGVFAVMNELASALSGSSRPVVIVMKSTVPVGTGHEVERRLRQRIPSVPFYTAANPEFLRQGSAIADFMRPERVVIGTESDYASGVMRALYRPLEAIQTPFVFTDIGTAELIKYAANAFLATKIAFINEIADLCEAFGAEVHDVARGMGLDSRIGMQFLKPGPGFGGSCFPKDCRALVRSAADAQVPLSIVTSVLRANEARKHALAHRIVAACGGDVRGKTLAVLGLTFKPNTDDLRDSPSLTILPLLLDAGARIRAFDPEGMIEAQKAMPAIRCCPDPYAAIEDADALVVLTEWDAFRQLEPLRIAGLLRQPVVVDLRNIYRAADMAAAGLAYHSIGRATAAPAEPQASAVALPELAAADA